MWDIDGIPTGPGLVKRHGLLDVNWESPTGPMGNGPAGKRQIPAWTAADVGKVLQVLADGSLAWVRLALRGTYDGAIQYDAAVKYDEGEF